MTNDHLLRAVMEDALKREQLVADVERLTRERDEARAAIVPPVSVTGSSQTGVGGLPADLVGALAAAEARERALREALQRIIAIEQGEIATKEELALALDRCGDIAQDALAAALASPGTEGTDE